MQIGSPFGKAFGLKTFLRLTTSVSAVSSIPAGAIKQRNGTYILDRAGSYIEVRA